MNKMKERQKFMAINIDLAKVSDRLNWNFIAQCLSNQNFDEEFINLIMSCITSSSYKVLWNGEKTNSLLLLGVSVKETPFVK